MKALFVAVLLIAALPARAGQLPNLATLTQSQFRDLAQDLGAALSYKGVIPATPLGVIGFDLGVVASATNLQHSDVFARAGNRASDNIYVPKLQLNKGLPWGLDIGAFVGMASNVDAPVAGADVRWAIVDDKLALPAVALRASGTRAGDIGGLRVTTAGVDLLVSKRLAVATPFAGVGVVRTRARYEGSALSQETFNENRYFAGLNLNLVLLNLAVEAERLGSNTTLSAKAGWRF